MEGLLGSLVGVFLLVFRTIFSFLSASQSFDPQEKLPSNNAEFLEPSRGILPLVPLPFQENQRNLSCLGKQTPRGFASSFERNLGSTDETMDVHSTTPFLRRRLLEDGPRLGIEDPRNPPDSDLLESALRKVSEELSAVGSGYELTDAREIQIARSALEKIRHRRGALDPDLDGAYAAAFFLQFWKLCENEFPDLKPALSRELVETGQTCVQGDSHRFLQLLLAALESKRASTLAPRIEGWTEPQRLALTDAKKETLPLSGASKSLVSTKDSVVAPFFSNPESSPRTKPSVSSKTSAPVPNPNARPPSSRERTTASEDELRTLEILRRIAATGTVGRQTNRSFPSGRR